MILSRKDKIVYTAVALCTFFALFVPISLRNAAVKNKSTAVNVDVDGSSSASVISAATSSATKLPNNVGVEPAVTEVSEDKKKCGCEHNMFAQRDPIDRDIARARWEDARSFVLENRLTFLHEKGLHFHMKLLDEVEANGVPGSIFECGVAKAGSSITFAAVKRPTRCLHLFDTFEGIPPPSSSDREGSDTLTRYGNILKCRQGINSCDPNHYDSMKNLLGYDETNFRKAGLDPKKNNVFFHKGLFQDTVWPSGPVAYAHLDSMWYDSTHDMLTRISPNVPVGGYLVVDDVYTWSSVREAFSDFFDVDVTWLRTTATDKQCLAVLQNNKRYCVFTTSDGLTGARVLGLREKLGPCKRKIKKDD